jgi:CBS domain-containing protein
MATRKIGCLPVIDAGQFVGIITETDLLRHFAGITKSK